MVFYRKCQAVYCLTGQSAAPAVKEITGLSAKGQLANNRKKRFSSRWFSRIAASMSGFYEKAPAKRQPGFHSSYLLRTAWNYAFFIHKT